MKKLLGCFLCVMLMTFGAQAHALSITPSTTPRVEGNETSQAVIDSILSSIIGTDVFLYKQDVGGGESGPLAGSYDTEFFNDPLDPADATITYTGGPIVDSPSHLLVKDGNQTPAWYLFELAPSLGGWDGMETLDLTGFWPAQGAISHVSLYGTERIPEPTTMLLIGTGLVVLVGFRRKFRK